MNEATKQAIVAAVSDETVTKANAAIAKELLDARTELTTVRKDLVDARTENVTLRKDLNDAVAVATSGDDLREVARLINKRLDAIERRFVKSKQVDGQTVGPEARDANLDDVFRAIANS